MCHFVSRLITFCAAGNGYLGMVCGTNYYLVPHVRVRSVWVPLRDGICRPTCADPSRIGTDRHSTRPCTIDLECGSLGIQWMKCPVSSFDCSKQAKRVTMCNRCSQLGHNSKVCSSRIACRFCKGNHLSSKCPNRGNPELYKCTNCNGTHASGDRNKCPKIWSIVGRPTPVRLKTILKRSTQKVWRRVQMGPQLQPQLTQRNQPSFYQSSNNAPIRTDSTQLSQVLQEMQRKQANLTNLCMALTDIIIKNDLTVSDDQMEKVAYAISLVKGIPMPTELTTEEEESKHSELITKIDTLEISPAAEPVDNCTLEQSQESIVAVETHKIPSPPPHVVEIEEPLNSGIKHSSEPDTRDRSNLLKRKLSVGHEFCWSFTPNPKKKRLSSLNSLPISPPASSTQDDDIICNDDL